MARKCRHDRIVAYCELPDSQAATYPSPIGTFISECADCGAVVHSHSLYASVEDQTLAAVFAKMA